MNDVPNLIFKFELCILPQLMLEIRKQMSQSWMLGVVKDGWPLLFRLWWFPLYCWSAERTNQIQGLSGYVLSMQYFLFEQLWGCNSHFITSYWYSYWYKLQVPPAELDRYLQSIPNVADACCCDSVSAVISELELTKSVCLINGSKHVVFCTRKMKWLGS